MDRNKEQKWKPEETKDLKGQNNERTLLKVEWKLDGQDNQNKFPLGKDWYEAST